MGKKRSIWIAVLVILLIPGGLISIFLFNNFINIQEEAHKPSMEIVFVEGPHNLFKSTQILFSVKNNSRKTLRHCRAVLYVYDEQKKKIFQSTDVLDTVSHWWKFDFISDRHLSIEEWNGVIKPKEKDYRLYFLFDTPDYFDTKEFKDKYGTAKYFVVQLYRQNELIDVMAKPNDFTSPIPKQNNNLNK